MGVGKQLRFIGKISGGWYTRKTLFLLYNILFSIFEFLNCLAEFVKLTVVREHDTISNYNM